MFEFCNHKLGKVESDGYQYCTKCGKAVAPPAVCAHRWVHQNKYETFIKHNGDVIETYYFVDRCQKCGCLKRINFNADGTSSVEVL